MGGERGICLVSQDIRERVKSGRITGPLNEDRIQPSSFEPTIGSEAFIVDTETHGLFRPQKNETVHRTLLQLPGRRRQKVDITGGFELKKGFTYLLPIEEDVRLAHGEYIKSSPKSSFGRLFVNTRLLADYNPCFDEINYQYMSNVHLKMWLLVQPLAFNLVAYPGLTLNQLRIFTGLDAKLTPSEVLEELKKNPLLYTLGSDRELMPTTPLITDDLQIHLDTSGRNTHGIVGLRARHNPEPIDLKEKGTHDAEHYFEPILKTDGQPVAVTKGEYYLFASKEVFKTPPHLNWELKSHSHVGISGFLHFAGFGDNGFNGDLVFEVRSDELSDMVLEDGMPISKLDLFRTAVPDKIYGEKIGSHYNFQVGPRTSKYFKPFDCARAARSHRKLSRKVIVQDTQVLTRHRKNATGFEYMGPKEADLLFEDIKKGFYHLRYDCEADLDVLQPITYILVFGPNDTVFAFVRGSDYKDLGEAQLFGKHSIGTGSHIFIEDEGDCVNNCLKRELATGKVEFIGEHTEPKFLGTLVQRDRPYDHTHFGLIYVMKVDGDVKPKRSAIAFGALTPINDLINDPEKDKKFETWSKVLIPLLPELKNKLDE